jgi:hypothetical protein
LRFLTCGGSDALTAIDHEPAVETGTAIEHHAAVDAAATLDGHVDHLLAALSTFPTLEAPPLTATASTRPHREMLRTIRETNGPPGAYASLSQELCPIVAPCDGA